VNRFDDFIKHRQYLLNVSHHTIRWYRHALKWLPSENPTQEELNAMVLRMREAGLKPTGCNAATRAINAYLHWTSDPTGRCGGGCRHPRIKPMKEPEFLPTTFTEEQVKRLVGWRPRGSYDRRLHLLVLLLLDTGARISELLCLKVGDIDFDNLLLTS
jgi:integrase/recombinase XerD